MLQEFHDAIYVDMKTILKITVALILLSSSVHAKSVLVSNFEFEGEPDLSRSMVKTYRVFESVTINGYLAYADGQNTYSCSFKDHVFEQPNSEIFEEIIDGGQICQLRSKTTTKILNVKTQFDNNTADKFRVKFLFNVYDGDVLIFTQPIEKPRDMEAEFLIEHHNK